MNMTIEFDDLGAKLDAEVRAYNDAVADQQREESAVREELAMLPNRAQEQSWQVIEQAAIKYRSKLYSCLRRKPELLAQRVELHMDIEKALHEKLAAAEKELAKAHAKAGKQLVGAGRGIEARTVYEHNPAAAEHQFNHEVKTSAAVRAAAEVVAQLEQDIKNCRRARPQTRNQREHAVAELQQFVRNTLGI